MGFAKLQRLDQDQRKLRFAQGERQANACTGLVGERGDHSRLPPSVPDIA